ncbi:hypothetical protein HDU92_003307 [Lobulomyces angularis]|nr:hypothetical protein HDU92_003307 [Lobulomyces angularis]
MFKNFHRVTQKIPQRSFINANLKEVKVNVISIIGNLTKEPTWRTFGVPQENGVERGSWNFIIATPKSFKKPASDDVRDKVMFLKVQYFGSHGELSTTAFNKGSRVHISGVLDNFRSKDGSDVFQIIAKNIQLLRSPTQARYGSNETENTPNNNKEMDPTQSKLNDH